jgi:hypothetical protein
MYTIRNEADLIPRGKNPRNFLYWLKKATIKLSKIDSSTTVRQVMSAVTNVTYPFDEFRLEIPTTAQ